MARPSDNALVRRVLVATKYRFIGDTLLVVPLLRRIAAAFPYAEVTLLTGPAAHELLEGCPYVQHAICFDPYRPADAGFRRFMQVVQEVRAGKFDIAFVCNRSFHSALIAALAGIPQRIGWAGFQKRDFLLTSTMPYNSKAPEICSYLDLLLPYETSGSVCENQPVLQLWLSDSERAIAAARLPLSGGFHLIGLQPGATHDEKRWPANKWADLMSALAESDNRSKFILIGGPDETQQAEELLSICTAEVRENTISLVGELKLRQTVATLSHLSVFVAGDTAIRHAAMALQTPTVALFGPTSAHKWGNPLPPRHLVLSALSRRVADIEVDSTLAAVLQASGSVDAQHSAAAVDQRIETPLSCGETKQPVTAQ